MLNAGRKKKNTEEGTDVPIKTLGVDYDSLRKVRTELIIVRDIHGFSWLYNIFLRGKMSFKFRQHRVCVRVKLMYT